HAGHALVPALDDLALAEREAEALAAVPRAVELLHVGEGADVVHGDALAGRSLGAGAWLERFDDELGHVVVSPGANVHVVARAREHPARVELVRRRELALPRRAIELRARTKDPLRLAIEVTRPAMVSCRSAIEVARPAMTSCRSGMAFAARAIMACRRVRHLPSPALGMIGSRRHLSARSETTAGGHETFLARVLAIG